MFISTSGDSSYKRVYFSCLYYSIIKYDLGKKVTSFHMLEKV